MSKPDVVIVWPVSFDYPLWRKFLSDNRHRFGRVWVVFTQTGLAKDIEAELWKKLAPLDVNLIDSDPVESGKDWRDVAVNTALKYVDAEWIWFTEQDFLPKEGFWEDIEANEPQSRVMAAFAEDRLHPCCIFIKRELLDQTSKNFAANSPHYDHFGKLAFDLVQQNVSSHPISPNLYHHMNGLTHNLRLHSEGQPITYRPEEFAQYLREVEKINE